MEWYLKVLRKYSVFEGRARRKEYWMFLLFNMLINMVLAFVESLMGFEGVLTGIYNLGILIPALAVSVRRVHDIGKSGWWLLINFVPIAGPLVFLYFTVKDGDEGSNEFGSNPKLEVEI